MAQDPPKSRPEPPKPRRLANPQPTSSVYGGQWGGGGGAQTPDQTGQPDRPAPIEPTRKPR